MDLSLRISLLGVPIILHGEQPLDVPRQQARALLYRLALDLQPVARAELCLLFWPDTDDSTARRNLTQLMSHVRRALPDPDLLMATKETMYLDAERVWSDTVIFASLAGITETTHSQRQRMGMLYRGPFLEGVTLAEAPEYEAWLLRARRRLEEHYLKALVLLMEEETRRGNYAAAMDSAQRYLALDPLDEKVHRQMIELHAAAGDRSAALRHYEMCAAILAQELGVDPLPETKAVYQTVLKGRTPRRMQAIPQLYWPTVSNSSGPLVGRSESLLKLSHQFRRAQAGQGQFVLITGEAGIGKSRLIQTFAEQVQGEATVLAAACYTNTQAVPYQPLVEALRPALEHVAPATSVEVVWLGEASLLFPELHALYPGLPKPVEAQTEVARGRLFEALRSLLQCLCRDTPVMVCLDDLHWSDHATLDWMSYMGRHLRGSRLLFVGSVRNEEGEHLGDLHRQLARQGCLTLLELSPLQREEIEQFVAQMADARLNSDMICDRLLQITGGNPFFLQETMAALVEAGDFSHLYSASTVPLTSNVRETIQRRLQRLSPLARQVLEAASVLGSVFQGETLRQTAGRQELETQDALDELMARNLLHDEYHQLRFHHELIQSVVYHSLSQGRRRLLHRRTAETLHQQTDTHHTVWPAPSAAQIGYHYAEGGETDRAVVCFMDAASQASHLHAVLEAIHFYQRALELLATLPVTDVRTQQTIHCHIGLGTAHMTVHGCACPQAHQAFESALALAQGDHAPATFPALWGLHEVFMFLGESAQAQAAAMACYRLAQESQDPDLLLQAHHALWGLYFHAPPSDDGISLALHHAQEGVRLYNAERHHHQILQYAGHDPGVCCRFVGAKALWLLGYPDQARRWVADSLALARSLSHPSSIAQSRLQTATISLYCGEVRSVQEAAEEVLALARQHQLPSYQAEGHVHLGWALARLGDVSAGRSLVRTGIAEWQALGVQAQQSFFLALLAEICVLEQQMDEGLAVLDEAMRLVDSTGERYYAPEIQRLRGTLLEAQGNAGAAPAYQRAIVMARRQGSRSFELRAAVALAGLWQAEGEASQAYALLAPLCADFQEGFDTADLRAAHSLLATLLEEG